MAGTSTNQQQLFGDGHSHSLLNPLPSSSSSSSNFSKTLISPIHEQTIFPEDQRFTTANRSSKRRSTDFHFDNNQRIINSNSSRFRKSSLSSFPPSFDERYFSTSNNHQQFGDYQIGELDQMTLSRTAKRLVALGQLEGNNEKNNNEWWENVLPPGQLAERLRRAQPIVGGGQSSSSSTSPLSPSSMRSIVEDSDRNGLRHSRKSILRSSDHSSQNTSSSNTPMLLSPPSSSSANANSNRERAGTWSSQSSNYGGSTRSSLSVGDLSSSNSSNDESPSEQRSPVAIPEEWASLQNTFGDRNNGSISPTSISRSKSSRRRRYIGSDTGLGLGVAIRGSTGSVIDLDERFEQKWGDGYTFGTQQADQHHPAPGLRPFPTSRISASYLSDTPEHSSAEEDQQHYRTSSYRPHRTSSTRTSETVCEREPSRTKAASLASAPSSRRSSITALGHQSHTPSRRVSFSQEVQVVQSNDVKATQTIGRAHGRSMSTLSDKFGAAPSLRQAFPSLNENSNYSNGEGKQRMQSSSLRTNGDSYKRTTIPSHLRGKRSTCYSAPTSPRLATMQMSELKDRQSSRLSRESTPNSSGRSTPRTARSRRNSLELQEVDADVVRMANMSSSLDIAHSQLSNARTLAMALTRQLSAPLRPFFHLTLLISISSAAFIALAGFLVAGYVCTVWDDIGSRGKSLQSNVHSAKKTIETRVKWTRAMLGYSGSQEQENSSNDSDSFFSSTNKKSSESSSTHSSDRHSDSTSVKTTQAIIKPFRFAFGLPFTVAYNMTPDSVRNAFNRSTEDESEKTKATPKNYNGSANGPSGSKRTYSRRNTRSSLSNEGNGFHNLPPRPPLSSLLPSIAFTIVIAFGAGLASFFANRAATTSAAATGETTGSTIPATTHRASSRASFHASSASTSSASARRHSHNHHYNRFEQRSSGSNKGISTFPTSSQYIRPRSSHSFSSLNTNEEVGIPPELHHHHHSRHSSTGISSGISGGRKSPTNWQEGVSSFL